MSSRGRASTRSCSGFPGLPSSKPHVLLLLCLGVYLIVLPIAGVHVSASAELIGGNYTNVTSDIGACIAAGGTLHLVAQARKGRKIEEERLRLARETHRLLHYVYGDAATQLGHLVVAVGPGRGKLPSGGAGEPPSGGAGEPAPEGEPQAP